MRSLVTLISDGCGAVGADLISLRRSALFICFHSSLLLRWILCYRDVFLLLIPLTDAKGQQGEARRAQGGGAPWAEVVTVQRHQWVRQWDERVL